MRAWASAGRCGAAPVSRTPHRPPPHSQAVSKRHTTSSEALQAAADMQVRAAVLGLAAVRAADEERARDLVLAVGGLSVSAATQACRTVLTHFSQRYPRVPAGLGLRLESDDEEPHDGQGAVGGGGRAAPDQERGTACCHVEGSGLQLDEAGASGRRPGPGDGGGQAEDAGAPFAARLRRAAASAEAEHGMHSTHAIAFDGMRLRLSCLPWLPLLSPFLDPVLSGGADGPMAAGAE